MVRVVGVHCHESRPALAAAGRTEAACGLLASVYARLTEGVDRADARDAWALLASLEKAAHNARSRETAWGAAYPAWRRSGVILAPQNL